MEHPGDIRHKNTTIEVQGKHFIVLNKTSKIYAERDGTWMNKLVLSRVTERDAGLYICLAANSMGYSVRRAYLTVHQGNTFIIFIYLTQDLPGISFLKKYMHTYTKGLFWQIVNINYIFPKYITFFRPK